MGRSSGTHESHCDSTVLRANRMRPGNKCTSKDQAI
jgi:hypothetical protein